MRALPFLLFIAFDMTANNNLSAAAAAAAISIPTTNFFHLQRDEEEMRKTKKNWTYKNYYLSKEIGGKQSLLLSLLLLPSPSPNDLIGGKSEGEGIEGKKEKKEKTKKKLKEKSSSDLSKFPGWDLQRKGRKLMFSSSSSFLQWGPDEDDDQTPKGMNVRTYVSLFCL